jgi:formamidase
MIHNRWHPDIPMACWVNPGRRLHPRDLRLDRRLHQEQRQRRRRARHRPDHVHYLSGPVGVKGAEPGDLLVVDLLDIGAKQDSLWGFNGFFSKKNGGGFLTDHFPLRRSRSGTSRACSPARATCRA